MKIIGIAAGKGGVGKSTVTANLALALKEKGFRVGVLDADVYGPSIHKMLGVDQLPQEGSNHITPAIGKGISYISIAFFRGEGEANAVRAPIANDIISQFLEYVDWSALDYLLIDFPPGTGDIPLTLVQKAPMGVVIVTTPGELALIDVRKAIAMLKQMKTPFYGVVENMSYFKQASKQHFIFGTPSGKHLAEQQGIPFLGDIPLNPQLSTKEFYGIADQVLDSKIESQHLKEFELIWNVYQED